MSTPLTTRPALLSIDCDTPVEVFYLLDKDFRWVVQPENFASLIKHVNQYGGPSFWRIAPLAGE